MRVGVFYFPTDYGIETGELAGALEARGFESLFVCEHTHIPVSRRSPFPGGGERIAALLGGHVDIMVIEPEEAGEHIRAGNMRVLAQVSEKRLAKFPEVPTLKEAGFDVPVVPQVRGVVAPPGIPKANVEFWQDFFRRLTRTPSWQKYIEDNQFEDGYQNAADLAKFYDEFTDRMRDILKDAGVKTVR